MQSTTTQSIKDNGLKIMLAGSQAADGQAPREVGLALADRDGKIAMPFIPRFVNDKYAERQWMKEHCAAAFRFFGKVGYGLGASGHISLRDPVNPHHIWVNPFGKHFSTMKASDLVLVDENGYVIEGGYQHCVNSSAYYIHGALHKARPDVNAACHMHSPHGVAWSIFGEPLETMNQDACIFHNRHSVYESFGGVVLASEEGERIAKALGTKNHSVILKNHGLLTTGFTVDEAAILFHTMERQCGVQLAANAAVVGKYKKSTIDSEDAEFTARALNDRTAFYNSFQGEYELAVEESNGALLK